MLKEFNTLSPFFEDCYRKINVREFSRLIGLSAPTASKLLTTYHKFGLLKRELDRNYMFFYANQDSELFVDLSRLYWKYRFIDVGLIDFLDSNLLSPVIFLFGSLSKAETTKNSDIDTAVFTPVVKELNLSNFEDKLNRKIQLFMFKDLNDVDNRFLLNNILSGFLIRGVLK